MNVRLCSNFKEVCFTLLFLQYVSEYMIWFSYFLSYNTVYFIPSFALGNRYAGYRKLHFSPLYRLYSFVIEGRLSHRGCCLWKLYTAMCPWQNNRSSCQKDQGTSTIFSETCLSSCSYFPSYTTTYFILTFAFGSYILSFPSYTC